MFQRINIEIKHLLFFLEIIQNDLLIIYPLTFFNEIFFEDKL